MLLLLQNKIRKIDFSNQNIVGDFYSLSGYQVTAKNDASRDKGV